MKRLSTAVAVIALIGMPAFAADMAVKAPAPMPAPVYNWTGWYAGVNAGASFGNVKTDFNVAPTTFEEFDFPLFASVTAPGFAGSDRTYPSGFIGGGQIGYNWQYSPLIVLGLEADFQGALEKDHSTLTNNFTAPVDSNVEVAAVLTASGTTTLDYQTKIDWFGTVRARLGYVWGNGDVLSYVTGGLAYGRVGINGTATTGIANSAFSLTQAFSASKVNTGWTIGYGTEGRLAGMPGWTWKVEGLYIDLGTLDTAAPGVSISTGSPFVGTTVTGGRSARTPISPTASFASV